MREIGGFPRQHEGPAVARMSRDEHDRTMAEARAQLALWKLQDWLAESERQGRARDGCPPAWARVDDEHPTRPRRVSLTLRIDKDVAKWFWQQGDGYQARINAVLRAYMLAKQGNVV
jgi:uncharacterized protein (DUF4415 family)